jgi:CYTH domain-containing protein
MFAAPLNRDGMPRIGGERMTEAPKYSHLEIERRWLVDLSVVDLVGAPFREIDDLYIADSRLRLRRVSGPNGVVFKLGKKYGKRTALAEPITNLYLTESEYRRFAALPGHHTRKRRYSLPHGSLDVYLEPNKDLAVFEVEFDDEQAAREFEPPPFVTSEITSESAFSGVSLAESRATA